MNLSASFILRPVMTTLLMIAFLILGIAAYKKIPVSNLPDVNYPTITVTVPFPGASPETMANTVATPLEKQFMTIPGMKYVTSSNTLGLSTIVLEFDLDKDIDLAAVDVDSAIVAARPNLPPNLPTQPFYKKVNPASTPILYIILTSPTMAEGEIYDYGNTFIGQRISTLEGVAQVFIYGSPNAVRAQVDPGMLAYLDLTLQDLSLNIANQNQYQPLGQLDGAHTASIIYDTGALYKAQNYQPVIVAYRNGAPIRVENLGDVVNSLQNDRALRRYIDKEIDQPSITLAILGQPGANAVAVADQINNLLLTLSPQLPGALEMKVLFDRSQSIRESINDVQLTLVIAFTLVVLVIFFYLGKVRDTVIPALVMPMSVIITFAIIYLLDFTLNNLTLLALTLAIGFIIDDAIVVLENIVRLIESGETPLNAALKGSQQIFFTIVSMTLSLVAVFIPLLFMAGLIGKLFQQFAMTLTIVTLLSGIISLTVTPMLCSRFLPRRYQLHHGKFAKFSQQFNQWMLSLYEKALIWVLSHRLLILTVGILSILCSLLLFKILPTDFIPDEDIGFLIAYTESEQGTSSDQMSVYQREVTNLIRKEPFVESLLSISASPQYRQGLVFMRLIPKEQRKGVPEIIKELNQKLNTIPGINVYLKNVPLIDLNVGSQVRGSYQFLIQSLDINSLYQSADTLLQKMQQDPSFQGISSNLEIKTPQTTLTILRDQASALGIDANNFEQTLSLAFSGNRISRIQTAVDQYDVILEVKRDLQRDPSTFYSMYLRSNTTNQLVPLSAVAEWNTKLGPASVNHFAQFPAVTLTFDIAPDIPLSEGLQRLRELAAESFASGVAGNVKGAAESFEESIHSIGLLLILTILTIYIVLGILYESFIHPLTILSTLPPAIVGALLVLYIMGKPLSLYAYLGIILLIGIVKKNGIMIVDFALENMRTKGESAEKSILEACLVRFRPIMMTTVAAIMGALPIALGIGAGAESRRPLGDVIIGGMVVSQLITLFLTPVIYLYFERMRESLASHGKKTKDLKD